jgi:hypothetical protein
MRFWAFVVLFTLFLTVASTSYGKEPDLPNHSEKRVRDALEILIRVPAGRALMERGRKFWKLARPEELSNVMRWGKASRTDAVLTRHLDPRSGAAETRAGARRSGARHRS